MVCGEEVWLGLGPALALAGMERDGGIHGGGGCRSSTGEENSGALRDLQHLSGGCFAWDLLLEGRKAGVALGRPQMKEPSQAPCSASGSGSIPLRWAQAGL